MILSDALRGFILSRDDLSPTTVEIYRWAINLIVTYLGDPPVETITSADLHRFFTWLRTEYKPSRKNGDTSPLSGRSLENIWTAMRSFYNWGSVELGLPRIDHAIAQPQYEPREIEVFTEAQCRALLACAERTRPANTTNRAAFTMRRPTAARDRAMILLLLDSGIRASECARLRVEDVDLDAGEIHIQRFGTGKKTKSRTPPISRPTIKALWRYLNQRDHPRQSDPLFLSIEERPIDRDVIRYLFADLGARAKIARCHPHRCRHTFCYNYIKNGGDPFTLAKIAGFSLRMALNYVHMAQIDLKDRHTLASPVSSWRL